MTFSRRVWVTILLILFVQIGVIYVQYGNAPAAVALPAYKVSDLPAQLGEWHSVSTATDIDVTRAVGADATQDQVYSKSDGSTVSMHFGIWSDPDARAPHLPQTCYIGNGWKRLSDKDEVVTIGDGSDSPVRAAMMTWQRDDKRVRTLHWYRRGDRSYFDWEGGCQAREDLWGNSQWPAVQKVLLQTDDDDNDGSSRQRLVDVASQLDHWMQSAP